MSVELPEGWESVGICEISRPRQHPTISKDQFTASGYPVYGANGQIGFYSDFTHAERTIAITCRGATCGTINIVPPKSYITGNAMALDDLDAQRVQFDFLNQALRYWGVEKSITGSAQPQITRVSLSGISIVLPPLPEQQRIAEILSSVDESIRATEAVIAQAERVKRGLMEDLLTGGSGSAAIANGEVPEGWDRDILKELFVVKSSRRVFERQWRKEGIPFYRGREITALSENGRVENDLFIDAELYEEFSRTNGVPKENDILITAIGTIGNTYLVDGSHKFYFKDASVLWLSSLNRVESKFVNYWLKSDLFSSQRDVGNGTTVDSLTIGQLGGLQISFPPREDQLRIVEILSSVDDQITSNRATVEQLQRLKRGLMDDLLTGKVRTVA